MNTAAILALALAVALLLAIFIFYLEKKESAQPAATTPAGMPKSAFGDLNGEALWHAMCNHKQAGWDSTSIEVLRPRFEFVLRRHISNLFKEGVLDGRTGNYSQPHNTMMVSTLRETIESWIPQIHAETLYDLGFKYARAGGEDIAPLCHALDTTCTKLFDATQLRLTRPMSQELITNQVEKVANVVEENNPRERPPRAAAPTQLLPDTSKGAPVALD